MNREHFRNTALAALFAGTAAACGGQPSVEKPVVSNSCDTPAENPKDIRDLKDVLNVNPSKETPYQVFLNATQNCLVVYGRHPQDNRQYPVLVESPDSVKEGYLNVAFVHKKDVKKIKDTKNQGEAFGKLLLAIRDADKAHLWVTANEDVEAAKASRTTLTDAKKATYKELNLETGKWEDFDPDKVADQFVPVLIISLTRENGVTNYVGGRETLELVMGRSGLTDAQLLEIYRNAKPVEGGFSALVDSLLNSFAKVAEASGGNGSNGTILEITATPLPKATGAPKDTPTAVVTYTQRTPFPTEFPEDKRTRPNSTVVPSSTPTAIPISTPRPTRTQSPEIRRFPVVIDLGDGKSQLINNGISYGINFDDSIAMLQVDGSYKYITGQEAIRVNQEKIRGLFTKYGNGKSGLKLEFYDTPGSFTGEEVNEFIIRGEKLKDGTIRVRFALKKPLRNYSSQERSTLDYNICMVFARYLNGNEEYLLKYLFAPDIPFPVEFTRGLFFPSPIEIL